MKIVIYDCEIKRGIAKRGEERIEGVEYCKGWRDFSGMGVSVTGVYDYSEDRYRVFCDDNVDEMLELFAESDLMVSFNGLGFDDPLLTATYEDFADVTTERYDLLVEIWRAAGLKPSWGSPSTHGGFGLDKMCEVNFAARKSGHGAMAPVDWQRGKIGSVIDYCLWDIGLTKMLMDCAINGDPIISPKGGMLSLRAPYSPLNVHKLEEVLDDDPLEKCPNPNEGGEDHAARTGVVNVDAHNAAEARKAIPAKPEGDPHHWDNMVIEIEQLPLEGKMMVAVHTTRGLLIKRKLMLHEWSQPVLNDALNDKNGPAVVKYLRDHEVLYKNIGDDRGTVE